MEVEDMTMNGSQNKRLKIFLELIQQQYLQDILNKLQTKNHSDQENSFQ